MNPLKIYNFFSLFLVELIWLIVGWIVNGYRKKFLTSEINACGKLEKGQVISLTFVVNGNKLIYLILKK